MAKIKEMTFARGATVNRGNFNSTRVEVAATIEVGDDETPDEAFARAAAWVNSKVKEQINNGE